ncbi:hypothetical protein [Sphingobium sp. TKS]|nr:hypothetical protein [Sphingobium sp. TKS]AMK26473.1 hypothetical protein K426_27870 [Sphingobium sp. TKS]
MGMAKPERMPIEIIDVAHDTVVLGNRAMHWSEPWSAVRQVSVARLPYSASTIFIVMLTIDSVDGERTIMISEKHENWQQVLDALPRTLPGIEAFEIWSRRPDIGSRAVIVYKHER